MLTDREEPVQLAAALSEENRLAAGPARCWISALFDCEEQVRPTGRDSGEVWGSRDGVGDVHPPRGDTPRPSRALDDMVVRVSTAETNPPRKGRSFYR